MNERQTNSSGFSAIEVLVVMIIIATAIALLLPGIQRAREAARWTNCRNNLKQIGIGFQNYCDRFECFPPGYVSVVNPDGSEAGPGWGWGTLLLCDLDQRPLFATLDLKESIAYQTNAARRRTMNRVYQCPSDRFQGLFTVHNSSGGLIADVATSNYVAINGNNPVTGNEGTNDGAFVRNRAYVPSHFSDGLSQTLFVGERASNLSNATWSGAVPSGVVPSFRDPISASFAHDANSAHAAALIFSRCGSDLPSAPEVTDADATSSFHPGGAQFVLGDGSVRFLSAKIAEPVFRALASRAGEEMLGDF